jgi:hypothetical protein
VPPGLCTQPGLPVLKSRKATRDLDGANTSAFALLFLVRAKHQIAPHLASFLRLVGFSIIDLGCCALDHHRVFILEPVASQTNGLGEPALRLTNNYVGPTSELTSKIK